MPHVANNSGNNEWYTPPKYIEATREAMGGIDLDPASSVKANETVGAETYYTAEDDGLSLHWNGRIWLNPPYSRDLLPAFVDKLLHEIEAERVDQACVLVNNATETKWAAKLQGACDALCLLNGRIRFHDATGTPQKTPLQGQVVYYFAGYATKDVLEHYAAVGRFAQAFQDLGKCFLPMARR